MEQKQSKYDAKPINDDKVCATCYYYADGFCTKEQKYAAVTQPNNEYCSAYSDDIIETAATQKRSV